MCGISGYLLKNELLETTNKSIKKMLELQKHRGPDDSGIIGINSELNRITNLGYKVETHLETSSNIILGFNRLSILDLSYNGHQPMLSPDKDMVLMMNGEIYNAFEYRDDLIAKGYIFKSTTDTEIVLHLYTEYGITGMLNRLNGMFAIVIWDEKLGRLFLIRDRFGIKPLYILEDDKRIAFSSEIKSFKGLEDFKFELDEDNLDEYLIFKNVINKTLLKNIRNLTPGTYLEVNTKGEYVEFKYYDISAEGKEDIDEKEVLHIIESSLKKAVQSQLMSDVKLGCQLSGGIDSSLVTYYANQGNNKDFFETISIVFEDARFSEEKHIDYVNSLLEINSQKHILEPNFYFENIKEVTWAFEQPINHPNTVGLYLLNSKAKGYFSVLLSGEGADEMFCGYSRFKDYEMFSLTSMDFYKSLYFNRSNLWYFLTTRLNWKSHLLLASSQICPKTIKHIRPSFSLKKALGQRKEILSSMIDVSKKALFRKYEILTFLPDLLMRQDKMSMAFSIENRVPFLDNNLVSAVLSIDKKHLIKKHSKKIELKALLKEISASIFDDKFTYRKKQGFSIPLRTFFSSTNFQSLWLDNIRQNTQKRGVFKLENAEVWLKMPSLMTNEQIEAVWELVTFEIWAQQYLD